MSLRDKVDNHPVVFFFSALVSGFLAGVGVYQSIISIANLEVISEGSAISRKELESQYILRSEHESLITELQQTIDESRSQWLGSEDVVPREQYQKVIEALENEKTRSRYVEFQSFDVSKFVSPRRSWRIQEIELEVIVEDVIPGENWEHTAVIKLDFPNHKSKRITAQKGDLWKFTHNERSFILEITSISTLGASLIFRLRTA